MQKLHSIDKLDSSVRSSIDVSDGGNDGDEEEEEDEDEEFRDEFFYRRHSQAASFHKRGVKTYLGRSRHLNKSARISIM